MSRRSTAGVSYAKQALCLIAAMAVLPAMIPMATSSQMDRATLQAEQSCLMKMDFSDPETVRAWRVVNDGVMGGRSQGTRFAEDDHMVFRGAINTNGGGFSSIRARVQPGPLAGTQGMRLVLRSDGRNYKMTFRTSERWRGRSVSYQLPIPAPVSEDWVEAFVRFENMETSVFGRAVRAAPFDPADIREVGIILADGRDGPFSLDVASLTCVPDRS